MNIIFPANIVNGKLEIRDQRYFEEQVKLMKGEVEVVVRRPRKNRSNHENKYYWAVPVKLISQHLGYLEDEVHEILKELHNSKTYIIKGKEVKVPQSTASLSTVEMEDYLRRIRMWASLELGVYIPTPNESDW